MRIKLLAYILGFFCFLIGLYFFIAFVFYLFPIHKHKQVNESIQIIIISNGFHTDFLIPVYSKQINWIQKLGNKDLEKFQSYTYISFGWGDLGFYLDSFSNDYPNISTILMALFIPTKTLIHVEFWKTVNLRKEYYVDLQISEKQYERLIEYINESIQWENSEKARIYLSYGYGANDLFFEAKGKYSLFQTCNNWTNLGLRKMELSTPIWCPLAYCILEPLKKY